MLLQSPFYMLKKITPVSTLFMSASLLGFVPLKTHQIFFVKSFAQGRLMAYGSVRHMFIPDRKKSQISILIIYSRLSFYPYICYTQFRSGLLNKDTLLYRQSCPITAKLDARFVLKVITK